MEGLLLFAGLILYTWVRIKYSDKNTTILIEEPNHGIALEMLIWDLELAGYFAEALRLAEHYVDVDPLSPNAQLNLYQTLNVSKRMSEAYSALELADQLGSVYSKPILGWYSWREGKHETSIAYYYD